MKKDDTVLLCLQDMEEFVQSSGDNGIVVFSLGSVIKNITREKANTIAAGLAQMPQKVRVHSFVMLWCNSGKRLESKDEGRKLNIFC